MRLYDQLAASSEPLFVAQGLIGKANLHNQQAHGDPAKAELATAELMDAIRGAERAVSGRSGAQRAGLARSGLAGQTDRVRTRLRDRWSSCLMNATPD